MEAPSRGELAQPGTTHGSGRIRRVTLGSPVGTLPTQNPVSRSSARVLGGQTSHPFCRTTLQQTTRMRPSWRSWRASRPTANERGSDAHGEHLSLGVHGECIPGRSAGCSAHRQYGRYNRRKAACRDMLRIESHRGSKLSACPGFAISLEILFPCRE